MPWLTALIVLPLVGVVALAVWRGPSDAQARAVALVVALADLVVALGMVGAFDPQSSGYQLVEQVDWVASLGLSYLVGVDGFSVWLVVLTAFMTPIAILSTWGITSRVRLFMALTLLLETCILGSFLALDLLLFFVFFEALLVPMFLMIGGWGSGRRVYAAVKFFLFTMAGSAFLLIGIVYLWFQTVEQFSRGSFDIRVIEQLSLGTGTQRWLFVGFFTAFAVKVPLFPLHTWLPDAHTEAPTAGSIVLAALLLKAGPYGMLRFNLDLFPEASVTFADAIGVLAVIGIVYGAVVAMMQSDVKRLVAYSSVSHMGFVVLGIFMLTPESSSGAVLQMVNHGLSTGLLFFAIGMLYERTHTRDMGEMGGLATITPWIAATFLIASLSSIGLPGLNNFVGEFLVILGSFDANRWLGGVAVAGVVLAAIYMLWAYQKTFHGPEPEERRGLLDIVPHEVAAVVPVLAVMLVLGVYPKVALDRINPSTEGIVNWVSSVAEGQEGLPGGLRAAIQDDYVPPPGSLVAAGPSDEVSP
ncbi:MAG TPA: NADH-quinone oxidoreductase subunit M [Actinomycetota bacterium]|nr:NADH-quinone oxidoreductase subunit M [Actinomycetota bacterium]